MPNTVKPSFTGDDQSAMDAHAVVDLLKRKAVPPRSPVNATVATCPDRALAQAAPLAAARMAGIVMGGPPAPIDPVAPDATKAGA